jgi:hypothetical protein
MDPKRASTDTLLAGINATINDCLGVADFRTKKASLDLVARGSRNLNGKELIRKLFDRLDGNWKGALARPHRASLKNFRWRVPKLDISGENPSREVGMRIRPPLK